MLPVNHSVDDVHRHLSAAHSALSEWLELGEPGEKADLLEVVRLFTAAQRKLSEMSRRRRDKEADC